MVTAIRVSGEICFTECGRCDGFGGFGGDVVGGAAAGAAMGSASGATSGAMAGGDADRRVEAPQHERLRDDVAARQLRRLALDGLAELAALDVAAHLYRQIDNHRARWKHDFVFHQTGSRNLRFHTLTWTIFPGNKPFAW